MAKKTTYVADNNPERIQTLKDFVRDHIQSEAHKAACKKYGICEWARECRMYVLTNEARAHAIELGLL